MWSRLCSSTFLALHVAIAASSCGLLVDLDDHAARDGSGGDRDGGGVEEDGAAIDGHVTSDADGATRDGSSIADAGGCPVTLVAAGTSPTLVWNRSEYGLAWVADGNVRFIRISPSGTLLGAPITLWTAPSASALDWPDRVALAWIGTGWATAWGAQSGLFFIAIDPASGVIGTAVRLDDVPSQGAALSWTGSALGLSWGALETSDLDLKFALVDPSGTLVTGSEVQVTRAQYSSRDPALAWNGSTYDLLWADSRLDGACGITHGLWFQTVQPDGRLPGSEQHLIDPGTCDSSGNSWESEPSIGLAGPVLHVAWADYRGGNADIYVAGLDASRALATTTQITTGTELERSPSLVWTGSELGLAFQGGAGVTFTRLDAVGARRSTDLVLAAAGANPNPSLTWNGTQYAVAWSDDTGVFFTRLCL